MNVYIDGENVSYNDFNLIKEKYLQDVHNILSIKVYGDWTKDEMKRWHKLCKKYSIDQKQCTNIPKKNVVDFHIVIDILDDIHTNDMNILKKILIVSSDSDYIVIHNRVVKSNIDIEVFSPADCKHSKYKDHDKLFQLDSTISIKDNRYRERIVHSHFSDEEYYEDMYDSNNYMSSDVDDNYMPSDENVYHSTNGMRSTFCDEEDITKLMKNIILCFRWLNKRKNPYKSISIKNFKNTYKVLSDANILESVKNYNEVYDYLIFIGKIIIVNTEDNVELIDLNYNETVFYENGLQYTDLRLIDIIMCYKYNNSKNKKVEYEEFFKNMELLWKKNILFKELVTKENLQNHFNSRSYRGFKLETFDNVLYISRN